MTDLILHKHERYRQEDLAYYFSGQRDVNNQVRPSEFIYSLTPDSHHFNIDFDDKKTGSIFFPIAPYSIDRIFIGNSFPLFANNCGAAILQYLMTRVKTGGCVILPVYPEMQAAEKNYWSRSILENVFLSRSRWKGTSNIWAENDGVMSMRVGRQFPAEKKSIASFFFEEAGNNIVRNSLALDTEKGFIQKYLFQMGQRYWNSANTYSIVEIIILEYFGSKQPVTLCEIGDSNGLMSIECLLSQYIAITKAVSFSPNKVSKNDTSELVNRYQQNLQNHFIPINTNKSDTLNFLTRYNVICLINTINDGSLHVNVEEFLSYMLERLLPGGILIVYEADGLCDDYMEALDRHPKVNYYSSIVASKMHSEEVISHYSSMIEKELADENATRKTAFRVIQA